MPIPLGRVVRVEKSYRWIILSSIVLFQIQFHAAVAPVGQAAPCAFATEGAFSDQGKSFHSLTGNGTNAPQARIQVTC